MTNQARVCTEPEQVQFMERLARNDLRIAGLESKIDSLTEMVVRAITRRQEDRSVRHLLD